ncbi:carbohydrate ABC transporter permease [Micromonospora chalcea]|uniref:Carbohydrate ABC transporter permease n=2 Tax=Micromonosporaceae TaxID=28056 RepID=A0ABX9Y1Y7_MICCH|nr:carbohydrate ABC transporter permease [Micromonospora chalcea]MBP1781729.1 cellobiose transport system permease protein [Micromonospora sp. HB375]MDH6466597.1 cellobiose transport system permease protein [Micromonospora sp. H404/HB375]ODB74993.1 sugar ABC transporter permease [Micromonospora sp. II]RBQ08588.1 carbohydrate ABC transporter permease [Micromonospora sp. LHW51205]
MTTTAVRPPTRHSAPVKTTHRAERLWKASPLTMIGLIFGVLLSLFPFYWMIVIASRTNDAANSWPPPFLPGGKLGENIERVLANSDANILKGLMNSFLVAGTITVATVFFGSLAGFAFAKLRFRGKNALLLIILTSMMVPIQLGVLPLYILMAKLDWLNTMPSVTVPFLIGGFGIFMMRQYAEQAVPNELIEAARVDGCSTWRVYWHVVAPALRPAAAVLGLLTFMEQWNQFFWPFVVLADPSNPTVQISLRSLNTAYFADNSQIFAGTLIATLPLFVVFVLFGRQIIGGIMEGAVKS